MTVSAVIDASALIAVLNGEDGHERALMHMSDCAISTVTVAEVVGKMASRGADAISNAAIFDAFEQLIMPLSAEQAMHAGQMIVHTRSFGLSLGDRCCLALAAELGVPAVTCDKAWSEVTEAVGVEVIQIR